MSACIRNVSVKCDRVSNPRIVEVPMLVYKNFGIKHCEDYHAITIATGKFEGYHLASFDTLGECYEFIKQLYFQDKDVIKRLDKMSFSEAAFYTASNFKEIAIKINTKLDKRVIKD